MSPIASGLNIQPFSTNKRIMRFVFINGYVISFNAFLFLLSQSAELAIRSQFLCDFDCMQVCAGVFYRESEEERRGEDRREKREERREKRTGERREKREERKEGTERERKK